MRTTLTIDDHLLAELKRLAQRTDQPLRAVTEQALRLGLEAIRNPRRKRSVRISTFSMGQPRVGNLDKALALSAEMEDEETARKLDLRK